MQPMLPTDPNLTPRDVVRTDVEPFDEDERVPGRTWRALAALAAIIALVIVLISLYGGTGETDADGVTPTPDTPTNDIGG